MAFDEARVRALSETSAQAMAAMAQMRAASLNQIYQTLTPEQRKKADELKSRFDNPTPRRPLRAPDEERPAPRSRGRARSSIRDLGPEYGSGSRAGLPESPAG